MYNFLCFAHLLFADVAAQAAPEAPANGNPVPGAGGGGGGTGNMMFFIVLAGMLAIMYVVMILPQKRERNRWNTMVDNLKKNDRVLMSCGIIGLVHSVHKEQGEIVVKVDDATNSKLTFTLTAITRVLTEPTAEEKK